MTLQVTPPGAWINRAVGELRQLPSGNVARLKPMDVLEIILSDGGVPDALNEFTGAQDFETMSQTEQAAMLSKLLPMINRITAAAFVEPRVLLDGEPDPAQGEIGIQHVDMADRLFVFKEMFGGATNLARMFSGEPGGEMDAVPDVQNVRTAAKRAGGPPAA